MNNDKSEKAKVIDKAVEVATTDHADANKKEAADNVEKSLEEARHDAELEAAGEAEESEGQGQQVVSKSDEIAEELVNALTEGMHEVSDKVNKIPKKSK